MIGYVTIGVSDMSRAKAFYSELLGDIGARVLLDMGRIAFIGESMKAPMLAVCTPYDGEPNQPGNGKVGYVVGCRCGIGRLYRSQSHEIPLRLCASPSCAAFGLQVPFKRLMVNRRLKPCADCAGVHTACGIGATRVRRKFSRSPPLRGQPVRGQMGQPGISACSCRHAC